MGLETSVFFAPGEVLEIGHNFFVALLRLFKNIKCTEGVARNDRGRMGVSATASELLSAGHSFSQGLLLHTACKMDY